MTIFESVKIHFLIPGHSHMAADRVVAHIKLAWKRKNIYDMETLIAEANKICANLDVDLIDHLDASRLVYSKESWKRTLSEMDSIPSSSTFTKSYNFDFTDGQLEMYHHAGSMDVVKHYYPKGTVLSAKKTFLNKMFGSAVPTIGLKSLPSVTRLLATSPWKYMT